MFFQKFDIARDTIVHIWVMTKEFDVIYCVSNSRIIGSLWFNLLSYRFIGEGELSTIGVVDDRNFTSAKKALRNYNAS